MKEQNLKEYLDTHSHKGFQAKPRYYKYGDFLTYFAKENRCVGKVIDEFLTVYISNEDGSIIGCKVKNVKQALSVEPSPDTVARSTSQYFEDSEDSEE